MVAMLDKLDALLRGDSFAGEPVKMFVAGGMALHFHCGARFTADVDAVFSRRLLLPLGELTVDYLHEDGSRASLYFDTNYNDAYALMHPDYRERAVEWQGIGNETRLVRVYVLTPLDLAVSKISRFSPQDRDDITLLAQRRFFSATELRNHALEALEYYIGNTSWVRGTIEQLCAGLSR